MVTAEHEKGHSFLAHLTTQGQNTVFASNDWLTRDNTFLLNCTTILMILIHDNLAPMGNEYPYTQGIDLDCRASVDRSRVYRVQCWKEVDGENKVDGS